MNQDWTKWENQVVNGVFPLRRSLRNSDHSAVFLTEHRAQTLGNALLKLVPAIPTLRDVQLSHWSAAAALSHPCLIRLLDTGRCQLGGLQFLFVVMEYAERTLAQILLQRALAPEELRKMLRPVLEALSFLHRKQLVQGGLKPSNVLILDRRLKLASDVVRPAGESSASIAMPSIYDPPESRDGSFSAAGDIWGLGMIMVETLTQQRPSWSERTGALTLPTNLPAAFVEIVRGCLNRNPAKRPTIGELEARIYPTVRAYSDPAPSTEARPPSLELISQLVAPPEPDFAVPMMQPLKRRPLFPVIAGIASVTAVAIWGGLRLFGSQAVSASFSEAAAASTGAAAEFATPAHSGATTPTEFVIPVSVAARAAKSAALAAAAPPSPRASARAPALAPAASVPAAAASARSAALAPVPAGSAPPPAAEHSVLHEELPDIPQKARDTIHGRILFAVRVTVDHSGNVVRAAIENTRSSRYFARLSTEAAMKWKFAPAGNAAARRRLLLFELTREGVTVRAT